MAEISKVAIETYKLKKAVNEQLNSLRDMHRKTGDPSYLQEYDNLSTAFLNSTTPASYKILLPYMTPWMRAYTRKHLER